jgi:hypothetical protein
MNSEHVDWEKITYPCHVCDRQRNGKELKSYSHDISFPYGKDSGTIIARIRHCLDNQVCINKARDYEWLDNVFLQGNK